MTYNSILHYRHSVRGAACAAVLSPYYMLLCVQTMMVSLIKLYVIHSGEQQQHHQGEGKYNNEMRNELR